MCNNFVGAISRSQTLMAIFSQKTTYQVDKFVTVVDLIMCAVREDDLRVTNFAHQHLFVSVEEWSNPDQHFIHKHSNRPPVD